MEGGLESLMSRTNLRFHHAISRGIIRPFPRRMHRRHRLRVSSEGPHWNASARTSIPACRAIHVHFQGPGHRLSCISTASCLPGSSPSPVCRPYTVLHRGDKTYYIGVQGAAKTMYIDLLKSAYVLLVNTESASPPAILSSITTCSGWRVLFPDYLGVQRSQREWFGGSHWLAHPRSQDILSSIHHNHINTETDLRV